jgi:hypothetical protein
MLNVILSVWVTLTNAEIHSESDPIFTFMAYGIIFAPAFYFSVKWLHNSRKHVSTQNGIFWSCVIWGILVAVAVISMFLPAPS